MITLYSIHRVDTCSILPLRRYGVTHRKPRIFYLPPSPLEPRDRAGHASYSSGAAPRPTENAIPRRPQAETTSLPVATATGLAAPVRVAVVDRHPVFRAALRGFLAHERDVRVVAEARSAAELLPLLVRGLPDVLLVDFATIELDTLGILGLLFRRLSSRRIILMHTDGANIVLAPPFEFHLCTLIEKRSVADGLVALIHSVCGRQPDDSPAAADPTSNGLE